MTGKKLDFRSTNEGGSRGEGKKRGENSTIFGVLRMKNEQTRILVVKNGRYETVTLPPNSSYFGLSKKQKFKFSLLIYR
jgi:hypothetical protein